MDKISEKKLVDRRGKDNLDRMYGDAADEEEEEEQSEYVSENDGNRTLFSERSLSNLTDVLGPELTIMLVMYLDVPTTTLAYMFNAAIKGRRERDVLDRKMLTYWATLRSTSPTEVKVRELVRALRACEQDTLADFVASLGETNDMFPRSHEYERMMAEREAEEEDD